MLDPHQSQFTLILKHFKNQIKFESVLPKRKLQRIFYWKDGKCLKSRENNNNNNNKINK